MRCGVYKLKPLMTLYLQGMAQKGELASCVRLKQKVRLYVEQKIMDNILNAHDDDRPLKEVAAKGNPEGNAKINTNDPQIKEEKQISFSFQRFKEKLERRQRRQQK